jgi:hypothetical protein
MHASFPLSRLRNIENKTIVGCFIENAGRKKSARGFFRPD